MCLGFMSFRAPSAALKQKNYHNSPNMLPIITLFQVLFKLEHALSPLCPRHMLHMQLQGSALLTILLPTHYQNKLILNIFYFTMRPACGLHVDGYLLSASALRNKSNIQILPHPTKNQSTTIKKTAQTVVVRRRGVENNLVSVNVPTFNSHFLVKER